MAALGFGTGFRLNRHGKLAAGFDFTGGALPGATSLTRPSIATRCDIGGALASVAADIARFDYDPVGHAPRGLLVEAAATNLMLNSQDWTQANWTKSNVTATAATLIETSVNGAHQARAGTNLSNGAAITISCIAAELAGSAKRYLYLAWSTPGPFPVQPFAVFDVGAGAVTATQNCAASVAAAPGGWLCAMAATPTADASGALARFGLGTISDSLLAYSGDGASGLAIAEMQVEAGLAATSRVRSGSSPGVRAADALTLPGASGTWRFVFDDGSTQDVALTASGGAVAVPTNLARPRIVRATLL